MGQKEGILRACPPKESYINTNNEAIMTTNEPQTIAPLNKKSDCQIKNKTNPVPIKQNNLMCLKRLNAWEKA